MLLVLSQSIRCLSQLQTLCSPMLSPTVLVPRDSFMPNNCSSCVCSRISISGETTRHLLVPSTVGIIFSATHSFPLSLVYRRISSPSPSPLSPCLFVQAIWPGIYCICASLLFPHFLSCSARSAILPTTPFRTPMILIAQCKLAR
jgi:hypothetical protein